MASSYRQSSILQRSCPTVQLGCSISNNILPNVKLVKVKESEPLWLSNKKNKEMGNGHYKTAKKKLLQLVCTLHANEQD